MKSSNENRSGFSPIMGILLAVVIFFVARNLGGIFGGLTGGFQNSSNGYQTYSSGGFSITVPEDFRETALDGYAGGLLSDTAGIAWTEANYAEYRSYGVDLESYSQEECLRWLCSFNDWQNIRISTNANPAFITYEKGNWSYLMSVFPGRNGYWSVTFWCDQSIFETMRPYFASWAGTVRVQ